MNNRRFYTFLTAVFFWVLFFGGADLNASEPFAKRLNYSIHLSQNPSEIERFAAEELKQFLGKIYQKNIRLNDNTDSIRFFVGIGFDSMMAGFTDAPNFGKNFGVSLRKRDIFLYGHDDNVKPLDAVGYTGTLLSVYYFLNRYASVDFFLSWRKRHFDNWRNFFENSCEGRHSKAFFHHARIFL